MLITTLQSCLAPRWTALQSLGKSGMECPDPHLTVQALSSLLLDFAQAWGETGWMREPRRSWGEGIKEWLFLAWTLSILFTGKASWGRASGL